jgi:hypothetical protein
MSSLRHIFLNAVVHIENFFATVYNGKWKWSRSIEAVTHGRRPIIVALDSTASVAPSCKTTIVVMLYYTSTPDWAADYAITE